MISLIGKTPKELADEWSLSLLRSAQDSFLKISIRGS